MLCYHAVSATLRLSVTPEQFRMQIERLLARGYRAVTFGAAAEASVHERVVAITFDDEDCLVFEGAAPILSASWARRRPFSCPPPTWTAHARWPGGASSAGGVLSTSRS